LNPRHFNSFTFISVSFRESCLLVSCCASDKCDMACSDEDRGRSRRPGTENRDGHTSQVLGGRAIERSGDTVCVLHRARRDEELEYLG
jgi:hypothetical protein